MFDKDIMLMVYVVCIVDSFFSQENFVYVLKDKDFVIFLDNINKNMGKMVSILVELYNQFDIDECFLSLK